MKYFILLITVAILAGCSAKEEYAKVYNKHILEFAQHNHFTTHKIKRDNYTLVAREFGKQYKANAPSILLMHGFPDSQHLYDELIPFLSKHRHVISFDYLGWGDSDKPKNHIYNTQSLIDDMNAVIEYFLLKDIVIVTHDASGPAGIDWAIAHPNTVHTLVLLNTYYYPMKTLVPPEAIKLFSTPSIKRDMTIAFAKISDNIWQSGMVDQINKFMIDPIMRDKYTKIFAHQALGIKSAFFGLNDVLVKETQDRIPLAKKRLGSFSKPVLIVFGAQDPYLNSGVAKEFHTLFPNSSLHLIENASHYVQIDKPNEVAKYILKVSQ